ncbi:hypothetical protein REPUB_Repub06bG0160300 [Reevesia pubescens]
MRIAGENLTQFYFSSVIKACASLGLVECGKQMHCLALKFGFGLDIFVGSNLVDMYSKRGVMVNAYKVFQGMDVKMRSCGLLLIDGYAKNGLSEDALLAYKNMKGFELEISVGNALIDMYTKVGDMDSASNVFGIDSDIRNIVSCSSLIDGYACASQAALDQGTQLRAQVIKFNFDGNHFVSSVLVDMYEKCGLLDDSIQVFDEIENATEIAWNSMLCVLAQHGLGKDAVEIFNRMKNEGVEPNTITFVSLLRGCSDSGLVEEGLSFFNAMEKTYGVVPREEHYSSCKIHGDKERGKLAAEKLMKLEPENSGDPVLLSNIYAE